MEKTLIDEMSIGQILKGFVISMNGMPIEKVLAEMRPDDHLKKIFNETSLDRWFGGWGKHYTFNVSGQKLADRFTSFDEMEDISDSSFAHCEYIGAEYMLFNYSFAEHCDFSGSKLKIDSQSTSFFWCNFENATIDNSFFDSDDFHGANLKKLKARHCKFIACDFDGCDATGADFTGSVFEGCNIESLHLSAEMLKTIKVFDHRLHWWETEEEK